MKKMMFLAFSVLLVSQAALASEKSCSGDADQAALPTRFNYTISPDGNTITLGGFVSDFPGVDFKDCGVATKAKSAFHFRDSSCNLGTLSINSKGVSINNTDGMFAYYKCH